MTIYKSLLPPVENLPETSLFSFLLPPNDPDASHVAFIDAPSGRRVTRGELALQARKLAYGLRLSLSDAPSHSKPAAKSKDPGLNVPLDSVVLIFSGNSTLVPLAILGCIAAGIRVSMASSSLTPSELAYQIQDSAPSHIFVQPELLEVVLSALSLSGVQEKDVRKRVLLLAQPSVEGPVTANIKDEKLKKKSEELFNVDDILVENKAFQPEAFEGKDAHKTVMLFYSSGTTGLPKGVEITHFNLTSMCLQLAASPLLDVPPPSPSASRFQRAAPTDICLGVMPHYHVYGAIMLLFHPLITRLTSLILPKFDPLLYLQSITRYEPVYLYIAPPVAVFLANHPAVEAKGVKMGSVRSVGSSAASLAEGVNLRLRERLDKIRGASGLKGKVHVAQGFGATEMSPAVFLTPFGQDHKPTSSGVLLPNIEARIIDLDGNDVKEGEPGELILRGPNQMKGYLNKPEATASTIRDGWLYTGDIVRRDEDGFYYIVDRIKELIKYKGFQISPVELENLLLTHPQVLDAAVVGIRDIESGNELPRAYVVPRDPALVKSGPGPAVGFTPDLATYVKERASHYKQLRGGVFTIQAIPKSAAGKILRRELRAIAEADAGKDKAKAKL